MKINLKEVLSGFFSTVALNFNFQAIKNAFDNTVSRDGTGPNNMEADLDMDSNRILNLPMPESDGEPLRLGDRIDSAEVSAYAEIAQTAAAEAEAFAQDAADGADSAAASAVLAGEEADRAEAAATDIESLVPTPGVGDEGKFLRVNSLEDAYELEEFYREETITLGGDLSGSDNCRIVKMGNVVTVSLLSTSGHDSDSEVSSAVGVIPEWARPSTNRWTSYFANSGRVYLMAITSDGNVFFRYHGWDGNLNAATNVGERGSITFIL